MKYQMNTSADGKIWYQLQWNDVEFKDFEEISLKCNSIEEVMTKILKAFPNCGLTYTYLGEKKSKKK